MCVYIYMWVWVWVWVCGCVDVWMCYVELFNKLRRRA
jgi:hypothetical protein